MHQVILNDKIKKNIIFDQGVISVEDQPLEWDLVKINSYEYHLLYKNTSYKIEIREEEDKNYIVKINGKKASAAVKDKLDILLEKLGLDATDSGKLQSIKAPMPGLIVEIKVKENVGFVESTKKNFIFCRGEKRA